MKERSVEAQKVPEGSRESCIRQMKAQIEYEAGKGSRNVKLDSQITDIMSYNDIAGYLCSEGFSVYHDGDCFIVTF